MKLQLAVDRVTIEKAIEIVKQAEPFVDIIEVGTSLIKDFGLISVKKLKQAFPDKLILADIKTVDEAEYEFEAVYNAGADIATVLGTASMESLGICQRVAQKHNKEYMIDLLGTTPERQEMLKIFSDGILCVHLPSDNKSGLEDLINSTLTQIHDFPRLAVAGGVKFETTGQIKEAGFEIAIVGGAITKSSNISETAMQFKQALEGIQ